MNGNFPRVGLTLLLAPVMLAAWIGTLQAAPGDPAAPILPPSIVGQVISQVSAAELEAHVCHLQDQDALGYCNTQGSRFSFNTAGLQEAAGYIADQFREHGLLVVTQPFTMTNGPHGEGTAVVLTNVIGTLAGVAPPTERGTVIVSAHYDSITDEAANGGPAPGADDNASGVAAVLEAARLLSGRRLWHTVRFIAFAGEEQGLHGSRHYAGVARAANEHIIGVVNADMIGYNGDGEPLLEIHAGFDPQNQALAHVVTETIQAYHLALWPLVVLSGAIRGSDHASFWDEDFPAILIIEDTDFAGPGRDFNPHYHTPNDTLDKMNTAFFTEMARAVIGTGTRLARPAGPDLRLIQHGPAEATAGQTVNFTLVYSNEGTTPTSGVILTTTLSYGLTYHSDSSGLSRGFNVAGQVTWNLGDLGVGASGSFVVTATVLSELPNGTSVSSQATVAGRDLDADGANNISGVELLVRGRSVYVPLVLMEIRD